MSYQHFELVCGHPETLTVESSADSLALSDAVEDVFAADTNLLVLQWNGIFVPLSFKYDVSWILLDAIEMIEQLRAGPAALAFAVSFPSNTFNVEWQLEVDAEEVFIEATWNAVAGSLVELLRGRSPLRVKTADFIAEWQQLFAVVVRALGEAGMPHETIDDYERLARLALFKRDAP